MLQLPRRGSQRGGQADAGDHTNGPPISGWDQSVRAPQDAPHHPQFTSGLRGPGRPRPELERREQHGLAIAGPVR